MDRMVVSFLIGFAAGFGFAASPASEAQAAYADLARVPPAERYSTRYLTTYADDTPRAVINFWLNSLSRSRQEAIPYKVSDTLYRFNLEYYDWSAEAWDQVAADDPYFQPYLDGLKETPAKLVLRVDYFIAATSEDKHYRAMLGLGDTVGDAQASFRIRPEDVQALRVDLAGIVLDSKVAFHNRRLVRYPTLLGYWWQSEDHDSDAGDANALDRLTDSRIAGGEFIWRLPNGLQAYLIANAQGKVLATVPPNIAQDYHTASKDKQVHNPRSCIGCHATGINAFRDDASDLIRSGVIELRSYDPDKSKRLEELFLGELPQLIDADQRAYLDAVDRVCGLTPAEAAQQYETVVYTYLEKRVTADQAARELGITPNDLIFAAVDYGKAKAVSGTIAALMAGKTVSREAWADVYPTAAAMVGTKVVTE